jgi:5-methylcytosine-specific restriction endonuclease McrA
MNVRDLEARELFDLAKIVGGKRYHKLTEQDLENYQKYDFWRYIDGNHLCGTTTESQSWVKENSDKNCPICCSKYTRENYRTIDHKLPRSQYPWLSLEFQNFWVICLECNMEKGEMHWYEYEHLIFNQHPNAYSVVKAARPKQLLLSLRKNQGM